MDGFDALLCTFTTYSLQTPFCPVLEHDQREKDERTGKYKTDLKQAYNRYEPNETKERLSAEGKLVTNDLSGKNEWIITVVEFNDNYVKDVLHEELRLGNERKPECEWRNMSGIKWKSFPRSVERLQIMQPHSILSLFVPSS